MATGFLAFKYFTGTTVNFSAVTSKFRAATDSKPKPSPSPRPIKDIGTGEQTFNFSHGSEVLGPKLGQVTLTPIDPKIGETQTITTTLKHDSPITLAKVNIQTDNNTTIKDLKLVAGTNTNGTWQATIKYKDSYDYNYYIKFNLQSTTGNYEGGLRLRQ